MYKIPLAEIKEKILKSGKIGAADLDTKIKHKITELSGLISEEGAAHIVANELGIDLTPVQEDLKIKKIYPGMRNVSLVGKVVRKFPVHEFKKGDSTGKVCSIVLGDETATIRVVFWNEQTDLLNKVNDNDLLSLKNVYVRDNKGNKEIHLGQEGEMEINPKGVSVGEVRASNNFGRKKIGELNDGEDNVEVLGTVVQVFDPRFFSVCPNCGKRAADGQCAEHGQVEAVDSYVLNLVVDDGTGSIRGVFWKNQTDHLLNSDVVKFKDDPTSFEEVKTDLLGEQFKLMGRVKRNDMFDRLEFNVQIVEKAKAEDEIKRLEAQ